MRLCELCVRDWWARDRERGRRSLSPNAPKWEGRAQDQGKTNTPTFKLRYTHFLIHSGVYLQKLGWILAKVEHMAGGIFSLRWWSWIVVALMRCDYGSVPQVFPSIEGFWWSAVILSRVTHVHTYWSVSGGRSAIIFLGLIGLLCWLRLYLSMSELGDYTRVYGVSMMSVIMLANLMC
jgi:hypothetical protein